MPKWIHSVRALAALIMTIAIVAGLLTGVISQELFGQVAMLVVGAYFAKRDEKRNE